MRERTAIIGILLVILTAPCVAAEAPAEGTHYAQRTEYRAPSAATAPVVDGVADDAAWDKAAWQPIAERWLGPEYTPEDFEGRYKVVWTGERIYLLAEISDDVLIDTHRDPLVQYWDDDTLEIFVDEDYSGGEHRFNHNAFAYHFSLDNRAIDNRQHFLGHGFCGRQKARSQACYRENSGLDRSGHRVNPQTNVQVRSCCYETLG